MDVLKLMRYIDDNSTVQLKGRVACEVSTCDELIATELVFENVLTALHPAEIVALLSSLVFQEKVDAEPHLTPVLQRGVEDLTRIATVVARAQEECGLDTPPAEFLRTTLHFGLVEVVHAWARGVPFADITGRYECAQAAVSPLSVAYSSRCSTLCAPRRIVNLTRTVAKTLVCCVCWYGNSNRSCTFVLAGCALEVDTHVWVVFDANVPTVTCSIMW